MKEGGWAEMSTAERTAALRSLVPQGHSFADIARHFGTAANAVAGFAICHDVPLPAKWRPRPESPLPPFQAEAESEPEPVPAPEPVQPAPVVTKKTKPPVTRRHEEISRAVVPAWHRFVNGGKPKVPEYPEHLVRRFEAGDSSNYYHVQAYLRDRGYDIVCASAKYFITRRGGRREATTWPKILDLVDRLRMEEGRQPLRPRRTSKCRKS